MSRRKFLKNASLVLGAPLAVAAGTRLYGEPQSVNPTTLPDVSKFQLPLSRSGTSNELWDSLGRIGYLWDNVLCDSTEAASFFASPSTYMTAIGLDGSDATLAHESLVLLQQMASPAVNQCLVNNDYTGLYSLLASSGAFQSQGPSALQNTLATIFAANKAELQQAIVAQSGDPTSTATMLTLLRQTGVPVSEDDLAAVSQVLANATSASGPAPMCVPAVCAAAIAVVVLAYVSVAIAATVVLVVGVYISAATVSAIVASTGTAVSGGSVCTHPHTTCIRPNGVSPPFNGTYARMDPSVMQDLDRSLKLAAMASDGNFEIEGIRSAIATEVAAVLGALKQTDLLAISDTAMPDVIDAVTAYAWKANGVAPRAS